MGVWNAHRQILQNKLEIMVKSPQQSAPPHVAQNLIPIKPPIATTRKETWLANNTATASYHHVLRNGNKTHCHSIFPTGAIENTQNHVALA